MVPKVQVHIVSQLKERGKTTPDFQILRQYKYIPLFVYDDFKQSLSQNPGLKGSLYLGAGHTQTDSYKMKTDVFPVVFEDKLKSSVNRGHIKGEVYAVTPEHILFIDRKKHNGITFKRVKKSIRLVDQEFNTVRGPMSPYVQCYMYLGIEEFWEHNTRLYIHPKISSGINANKKFYNYFGPRNLPNWPEGLTQSQPPWTMFDMDYGDL